VQKILVKIANDAAAAHAPALFTARHRTLTVPRERAAISTKLAIVCAGA
jgi:hypothetical protein